MHKIKNVTKVVLSICALTFGASALSACNTVEGMGEDIEAGGEKMQDGSRNVKERM